MAPFPSPVAGHESRPVLSILKGTGKGYTPTVRGERVCGGRALDAQGLPGARGAPACSVRSRQGDGDGPAGSRDVRRHPGGAWGRCVRFEPRLVVSAPPDATR